MLCLVSLYRNLWVHLSLSVLQLFSFTQDSSCLQGQTRLFLNYSCPSIFSSLRLVLSSVSDYFAAMFTSNVREAKQDEVKMEGVDPEALWVLVQYAYTGEYQNAGFLVIISSCHHYIMNFLRNFPAVSKFR